MRQTWAETRWLIRADIEWRCQFEHKKASRLAKLRMRFHPGIATVMLFRWQRFYDTHRLPFLGGVCRWLNLVLFTSVYSSNAQVAGGFLVVHAVGITVGSGAVIGPRCVLFAQNAILRSPFIEQEVDLSGGAPIVEEDVIFGLGASAQGYIRIAKGCFIGMNSLVDFNTEPGTTLLGVPARVTLRG